MATYRTEKGATLFTRIENSTLRDSRLSWKARGLLAYMLSKPDNFEFRLDELIKHTTDGKDSTRAGLKELEQLGYVKKYAKRDNYGKIASWEMDVYETPESGFPDVGFPDVENPTQRTNDLLRTNDYKNERKIYTNLPIGDDEFLQIYNHYFVKKFKKQHMRVTQDQLEKIIRNMDELRDWDIEVEQFEDAVAEHFNKLADSNDGNILAFIPAFMRHFTVHPVD